MSEFTIRNKSTRPIVTLRPQFLALMLEARPDSASLVLAKYCKDYKKLTGKEIHLDHDQNLQFLARFGADENGMWTGGYANLPNPWYAVERAFVDGFLARGLSPHLQQELEIAEAFYGMLDPIAEAHKASQ